MDLLHGHILERLGAATAVFVANLWPHAPLQTAPDLDKRLRAVDPMYPRYKDNSPVFLLFDEAQATYGDGILWNDFFKGVADRHTIYRVVLFCSYGSHTSPPVTQVVGTPLCLRPIARVSLSRTDVEGSVGILLERSEFDEVISRFEQPMKLHPDLQNLIFTYTDGHVGAVVELLRMMWNKVGLFRRDICFI